MIAANAIWGIVERWVQQLGPSFTINFSSDDRSIAFGLAEKVAPFRTPAGHTSNRKAYPPLSKGQLLVIGNTSVSDQEFCDRLKAWFFDGVDTTRREARTAITPGDVEKIVQKAVAEALQKQADALIRAREEGRLEKLADEAARVATIDAVMPKGIQHKPRANVQKQIEQKAREIAIWEDRCKLMGKQGPVMRNRDGRIDGRWLRRAEEQWADYCSAKKADATPVVAQIAEPQPQ